MMMRNWTLVSVFATLAVASWAQRPAQTPTERPDNARQERQRTPRQIDVPPALNPRRAAPDRTQRATPTAKDQLVRPGQADSAPVQSRRERSDPPDNAPNRPTLSKKTPELPDTLPRGPEHAPGQNRNPRLKDNHPTRDDKSPVQTPTARQRVIEKLQQNNSDANRDNGRPTERPNRRPQDDSPTITPSSDRNATPAPRITPSPGNTPRAGATPDISDVLKRRSNNENPADKTPIKTPVRTPSDLKTPDNESPSGSRATPLPTVSPDATPFVPTDMPERLRRNGSENRPPSNRPENTPASENAETPSNTNTPQAETPSPGIKTPGSTPPAETPESKPGSTPSAQPPSTPAPSPTAAPSGESAEPAKTPRVTPVTGAPTPESAAASPSPSPATTLPAPGTLPGAPAQTPSTEAGRKAVERLKNRTTIPVSKAGKEDLNQAAEALFNKTKPKASPAPGQTPAGTPAPPKLTPWVQPNVVTSAKEAEEAESKTGKPVVVMPPPGATPTPTPAPDTIVVSDPSTIINNIQNITLAPTPPPAPTPGATPVPTPPGVTPVPTNFRPDRNWVPYPGWRPPKNWDPPKGWVPPGGWTPPPGWEPPREWVPRLRRWGWNYIAHRGWVVPVQWTPPPDFVVPPGWYYMPSDAYDDYGFYDPAEVVVFPGHARPDLQININVNQVYLPPKPPPVQVVNMPPPPPRPAPPEPPLVPEQITNVETVAQILTRPRDPNGPRYQGPVLVTGSVHFDFDSYAIRPDSFPTLDAIGQALVSEMPDAIINVEGHTDSKGTDEYNQTLSEQRAWSVKSYLVQKFGLDPNRLIIVGYGERAPIADNDTDAGRARNRRVEFENVTDLYKAQVVETAQP